MIREHVHHGDRAVGRQAGKDRAGEVDREGTPSTVSTRENTRDRWARLLRPAMKERGVLLPPNRFESQFLSAAHTGADVDRTQEAYKHALA